MDKKVILFVFGTRPEVIKLAPVILELQKYPQKYEVLITPKNYSIVKNQIFKLLINNDNNISMEFVNILYSIGVNQIKFQRIYSKLFKDIDKLEEFLEFTKKYNKEYQTKEEFQKRFEIWKQNYKKIQLLNKTPNISPFSQKYSSTNTISKNIFSKMEHGA